MIVDHLPLLKGLERMDRLGRLFHEVRELRLWLRSMAAVVRHHAATDGGLCPAPDAVEQCAYGVVNPRLQLARQLEDLRMGVQYTLDNEHASRSLSAVSDALRRVHKASLRAAVALEAGPAPALGTRGLAVWVCYKTSVRPGTLVDSHRDGLLHIEFAKGAYAFIRRARVYATEERALAASLRAVAHDADTVFGGPGVARRVTDVPRNVLLDFVDVCVPVMRALRRRKGQS